MKRLPDLDLPTVLNTSERDLIEDLFIPLLSNSALYDRGVGYFSSGWLRMACQGMVAFADNGGLARWITSPILDEDDWEAMQAGDAARFDPILKTTLDRNITDLKEALEEDTLSALAWLIADEVITFKLALPHHKLSGGEFHDKFGIFTDSEGNKVSFNGSYNDSIQGTRNYESIKVFRSWNSGTASFLEDDVQRFERLWHNLDPNLRVFNLPSAAREKILKLRTKDRPYAKPDWVNETAGRIDEVQAAYRIAVPSAPNHISLQDFKTDSAELISSVLRHDKKQNTYKFALIRAINDIVLSFPDVHNNGQTDVAVPLRMLAEYWIAYFWPFADPAEPIMQGPRLPWGDILRQDIAFRKQIEQLRLAWRKVTGSQVQSSDGFLLVHEMRVPRKRREWMNNNPQLVKAYDDTVKKIIRGRTPPIEQPIQHAGRGQDWGIFESKPTEYRTVADAVNRVPGTRLDDRCLLIPAELWQSFQKYSLWIEALCIHEWSLFTEEVDQEADTTVDRCTVYCLLTDRPDNRRPLTWERNKVDLLIMEGETFICPWTRKVINQPKNYDLDHIIPVSVYPTNELWNLVPSDSDFNSQVKRDRIPSKKLLSKAKAHLVTAYTNYDKSESLSPIIQEDAMIRFVSIQPSQATFFGELATTVIEFADYIAKARNLARF